MKRVQILIAVLVFIALPGCEWPLPQSRYQLINSTDGKVYRLDAKTGMVHYISPGSMVLLSDATPMLQIGEYYQMSDAKDDTKFLKHLGNGQFEKSQFAIRKRP